MTYRICYWDDATRSQKERNATPTEVAEIDARKNAPAPVPYSVSRRQARQALYLAGKLSLVQPAIDAIPDATQKAMVQIEWDDAQEFLRSSQTVALLGAAIGLSNTDIDNLFRQAAGL